MSCKHGNHESACDICDEVDAAYESGLTAGRAAPSVASGAQDERAMFEADTLEVFAAATFGRFPVGGNYNVSWVQEQWNGWQRRAAIAAQAKRVEMIDGSNYDLAQAVNSLRWFLNKTDKSDTPNMRCTTALDKHKGKHGMTVREDLEWLWRYFQPKQAELDKTLLAGAPTSLIAKRVHDRACTCDKCLKEFEQEFAILANSAPNKALVVALQSLLKEATEGDGKEFGHVTAAFVEGKVREALAALDGSAPVAAVQGYKLVPLEPTDEMVVAFAEEWYSRKQVIDDPDMADAYKAMLAVAPEVKP